jgi:hypothetical protein
VTSPSNGSSGGGSTTAELCFVAEHQYGSDIRGDHMIRVVSPTGVFAEAVGVPGAKLEIRAPQDNTKSSGSKGSSSDQQQVSQTQSEDRGSNSGSTQQRSSSDQSGQSNPDGNPEGQRDGSAEDSAASEPLKVRPKDRIGLRAVVVFPDADEDDERDVTNAVEWKSSKTDVATVNTSTGIARGELLARAEGNATITARYSGMVAKRKLVVAGQTAKSLRIESANGEKTVKKGSTLPLRATAAYDSGQSEQVTEDVTWSSSDEQVADVDSGGEVEGVSAGSSTIRGTYKSKDGGELSAEFEVEVTDTGGGQDSGSEGNGQPSNDNNSGEPSNDGSDTGGSSTGGSGSSGSGGSGDSSSGSSPSGSDGSSQGAA